MFLLEPHSARLGRAALQVGLGIAFHKRYHAAGSDNTTVPDPCSIYLFS